MKLKVLKQSEFEKKIFQTELLHTKKEHTEFLKKYKPAIIKLSWGDWITQEGSDESEMVEVFSNVKSSDVKLDYKEVKNKMFAIFKSATINEVEFDKKDGDQKDRFNDKDWSSGETIMPFFAFIDIKTKKIVEFKFDDTSLSSFELSLN
jgi:hypothetical protein